MRQVPREALQDANRKIQVEIDKRVRASKK
jgi:hypothetical protein